jgi:hypothetical protein
MSVGGGLSWARHGWWTAAQLKNGIDSLSIAESSHALEMVGVQPMHASPACQPAAPAAVALTQLLYRNCCCCSEGGWGINCGTYYMQNVKPVSLAGLCCD